MSEQHLKFEHDIKGIPTFDDFEYAEKKHDYVLLIPVLNESKRLHDELKRGYEHKIHENVDIVICDGGSSDDTLNKDVLTSFKVNAVLVKTCSGGYSTQLRMGIFWALNRGYKGVITIDGNNKDSIEDIPSFILKLKQGYDFIQGSRFLKYGKAERTPISRYLAIRLIHAPICSLSSGFKYTDTTNGFRAYSRNLLASPKIRPLQDKFDTYELLCHFTINSPKLGFKTCEIPVKRIYPMGEVPTKISSFRGNILLFKILIKTCLGK